LQVGSGISRGNRATARGLAELLHLFEPHVTLLRRGGGAASRPVPFPASAPWRAMPTP